MAKRYYWLKLPDGFFRQKAIKKLRKIAGGDTYTIIYLKMLLVAMKQDGRLYFEGVEATFYDELALDLDEEVENVRVTVMFLIQQDLMQLIDETEYSLSECAKMTGSESTSAARVRKYRSKEALQCNEKRWFGVARTATKPENMQGFHEDRCSKSNESDSDRNKRYPSDRI